MKKLLIAASFLLLALSANAEIKRVADSFDGSIILESNIYSSSNRIGLDGYNSSDITGPFSYSFYQKRTASGNHYNMLYVSLSNTRYTYFGYDSQGSIKVDETIIPLTRLPFESISYIYLDMTPVLNYLRNGMNHDMTLRISGSKGTFTAKIDEAVKKEWMRVAEMNINDEYLLGARPFGSSIYTVGKTITGWATDPKNLMHKPVLHVYRGNNPIAAISANIEDCKTGRACAALPQKTTWRKYVYEFNLENVSGPSPDPIRLIAINSNPAHPPEEIASAPMVLRDDIECVYNWAEKLLIGDIISEKKATIDEGVHRVRRYSNQTMMATVYGSGDFSFSIKGGPLTPAGNLSLLLKDAIADGCGR